MIRRIAVLGALLVACSALVLVAFTGGAAAAEHEIDSCTVIDEPGDYELVDDVQHDGSRACLEVRADDVTIDGNGHTLEGPGVETDATGIGISAWGPAISDIEIYGWRRGIFAGGNYELSNAVLRGNGYALQHSNGGADQLTDVTIENNNGGILAEVGSATGTNVTIRDNGWGVHGEDGGTFAFDESNISNNDEHGLMVGHFTNLELTDSTVSGNGGSGIAKVHDIGRANLYVENSTVANNGGDGIVVIGPNTVQLTDVTVTENDGLEVRANVDEGDEWSSPPISASDLHVGPSATLSFENETVALEPVDAEDLPARDDGTAVGDGLNISGNVSGPIDLELDVDTDDETADLWRYDGTRWATIDADLPVDDGAIHASVDRNGVFAPGTGADQPDDDPGDDEPSDEDGSKATPTPTPSDQDGEKEKDTPTPTPSDQDGEKKKKDTPTPTPSDKDGEKEKDEDGKNHEDGASPTPDESADDSCGSPSDSGTPDGQTESGTSTPDDGSSTEDDPTPAGEATPDDEERQQADADGTAAEDDGASGDAGEDDESLAAGPGLGPVVAVVALLAAALLARRLD